MVSFYSFLSTVFCPTLIGSNCLTTGVSMNINIVDFSFKEEKYRRFKKIYNQNDALYVFTYIHLAKYFRYLFKFRSPRNLCIIQSFSLLESLHFPRKFIFIHKLYCDNISFQKHLL